VGAAGAGKPGRRLTASRCGPFLEFIELSLADDGCAAALESGIQGNPYGFLRRWLERRPQLTLCQVDPIIRQLTLYRDLIADKTQENPS